MVNYIPVTFIEKGKGKGQDILDAASSHINNYNLPDHEPFRAVFYSPFRTSPGGFYEEVTDTVQFFGSAEWSDRKEIERAIAHEKLHAAIKNIIVGPINPEVKKTFIDIRKTRKKLSNRLSKHPFTEKNNGDTIKKQIDWIEPVSLYSIHWADNGREGYLEKVLDTFLLEDQIICALGDFEDRYSDEMSDERFSELNNYYDNYIEREKEKIDDRKNYLLDLMMERRSKVLATNHPAEEAIVTLFSHTKPTLTDFDVLGEFIDTEGVALKDLTLDNPEYMKIKSHNNFLHYDKDPESTTYNNNDRTVESWMRDFHSLYLEKRFQGLSEEGSFNEVFYYALEEVLEPYAEEQLEKWENGELEVK